MPNYLNGRFNNFYSHTHQRNVFITLSYLDIRGFDARHKRLFIADVFHHKTMLNKTYVLFTLFYLDKHS